MIQKHPNLFLIGFPKSGTTALASELASHSDIYMPIKEPRFYDRFIYYDFESDYRISSFDDYLAIYKDWNIGTYALDASNFIVYDIEQIKQIKRRKCNAKFILVLRDPIEASISMHSQRLKYQDLHMREISSNFEDCWKLINERKIGKGFPNNVRNKFLFQYDALFNYVQYVPKVLEFLQTELLIIDYAQYKNDPATIHRRIQTFLELDYQVLQRIKVNQSYTAKANFVSRWIKAAKKRG